IRASYDLLGFGTYFTAGEQEVRAWTVKKGMKAPQAAGIIHTDFERGFIRAETVSYDDLMAGGSMAQARENGKVRLEGKEYIVQDRSEEHTSELQSRFDLVCRLLLEKKKNNKKRYYNNRS